LNGKMLTNGWQLLGKQVLEHDATLTAAGNRAINLNGPVSESYTCTSNNITLYTTNDLVGTTNFQPHIVILRASGQDVTLHTPSGWSWQNNSPVDVIYDTNLLYLEIRSVGSGETNKIVSAWPARDNTFTWDADAQAFFDAAA